MPERHEWEDQPRRSDAARTVPKFRSDKQPAGTLLDPRRGM